MTYKFENPLEIILELRSFLMFSGGIERKLA